MIAPNRYAIELTWKPEVIQSGKRTMSVELVGVKGLFNTTGGLFSANVVRPEGHPALGGTRLPMPRTSVTARARRSRATNLPSTTT